MGNIGDRGCCWWSRASWETAASELFGPGLASGTVEQDLFGGVLGGRRVPNVCCVVLRRVAPLFR